MRSASGRRRGLMRPTAGRRHCCRARCGSWTKAGVWDQLARTAAPLRALRLIDRTGRLFRAPDMLFDASEIGLQAFGYNVPNTALIGVLINALGDGFLPTPGVRQIERSEAEARLALADGSELSAKLVVGADGRNSLCREAAGIGVRSWSYDQTAIVCNFHHKRPHQGDLYGIPFLGRAVHRSPAAR